MKDKYYDDELADFDKENEFLGDRVESYDVKANSAYRRDIEYELEETELFKKQLELYNKLLKERKK